MKYETEHNKTSFSVEAGTVVKLGGLSLKLDNRTDVSVEELMSYDAIAENLYSSGNGPVNADALTHREGDVIISYNAMGGRVESVVEKPVKKLPSKPTPKTKLPPVTREELLRIRPKSKLIALAVERGVDITPDAMTIEEIITAILGG